MLMNRAYHHKPPSQTPCAATVSKKNLRTPSQQKKRIRIGCRLEPRPMSIAAKSPLHTHHDYAAVTTTTTKNIFKDILNIPKNLIAEYFSFTVVVIIAFNVIVGCFYELHTRSFY